MTERASAHAGAPGSVPDAAATSTIQSMAAHSGRVGRQSAWFDDFGVGSISE